LHWSVLLTTPPEVAFAPQRQLLLTLLIGIGVTALLVSAIAAYLANRATRPLLAATDAVEQLGQGKFDTRISTKGNDELAVLGSNINVMASQLQTLLQNQALEAERAVIVKTLLSSLVISTS
jgi:nitrate/nitrite-specific signal transduction histidine kinase